MKSFCNEKTSRGEMTNPNHLAGHYVSYSILSAVLFRVASR
ncbi:Uncharacterized protein APZ42_004614 [Daphnia magna]|uniref:Uncharacterized protein n=1 Tax=Daphnia magna TaxID=35525 RepID=A0A164GY77_9CRUS|nr:Uncharacterized protein APZ42_004614 [Daphnia magna]